MNKCAVNSIYVNEILCGLSIWDIALKYNDTYKNVYESTSGKRFEARFLPETEKQKICDLYLSRKMSTVQLGQLYGVGNKCIAVVLKERDIQRCSQEFNRQYSVDEHYFDAIDNSNKAYCFGLIAADGNVNFNKRTISICLEECDKEILELVNKEIKNSKPIDFIDYSNKHDFGYTYKNQYCLRIFSTHMCNTLISQGIAERKSYHFQFPKLDTDLLSHFVRGYFDGNGSMGFRNVTNYMAKSKGCRLSLSITSTFEFCNSLSDLLLSLGIYSKVAEASNKNGITAALYISKIKDINLFLEWMYKDANIYLKRKHDIYLQYKKDRGIDNSL